MPNTPSSPEPTSGCKDCDVHVNGLCDAYPDCGRGRAEEAFVTLITAAGSIVTPHGIMQLIPPTPFRPDLLEIPSEEERRKAAQRYIQERYGKVMRGNFTSMISRETGGSDPLVPEPKD